MKSFIKLEAPRQWLSLCLVSAAVFVVRILMLSSTPYASGLDGYYYAIQIKSLHDWGDLIIGDTSPVFSFLYLIDLFVGDPVLSTKLASALLSAGLPLVVCLLASRLGASQGKVAIISVLVALSPTLALLSVDYVKNLWALNVLGLSIFFWLKHFSGPPANGGSLVMALLLSMMTYLSHRLSAVVIVLFLFALFTSRYHKNKWYWILLALFVLALGLVLLVSKRGLQALDFLRVLPQLVLPPSLPLASPRFSEALPLSIAIELTLSCLVFWFLMLKRSDSPLSAIKIAIIPLLLPIYDFGQIDLGFRLFSSALPFVYLIFIVDLDLTLSRLGNTFGLVALPLVFASFFVYDPRRDPPYAYYQKIVDKIELGDKNFLIAHGGLNHFYTYNKSLRYAMNFTPDFELAPEHLWRLSYGINIEDYRRVLPLESNDPLVRPLDQNYVLIREDVFQTYYQFLHSDQRASIDNWYNPLRQRPAFLRD